jgi:hypothetical protein
MSAPFFPGIRWGDVQAKAVEPGTVITGPSGDCLTVRDGKAVARGGTIFLTHADYAALKASPSFEDRS